MGLVAAISEAVGRFSAQSDTEQFLRLRKINRVRTIQGSLAIEGNTLSEEQITAILEGRQVIAPPREILEARNAIAVYDRLEQWNSEHEDDLLKAHAGLMAGLVDDAGAYRQGNVGILAGEMVTHMAPPAPRVPSLMRDLFQWLKTCEQPALVSSSVFHYEFEFIHPFSDGNGRMGRLWQTLILAGWNPLFAHIPVESLVRDHQGGYYEALRQSSEKADSAPFIEFMLRMIHNAVSTVTPQATPQATPQVETLLNVLEGEMSLEEILIALGLRDRKSCRDRYIRPALELRLIEMTIPDKPKSPLQKYRLARQGHLWLEQKTGE